MTFPNRYCSRICTHAQTHAHTHTHTHMHTHTSANTRAHKHSLIFPRTSSLGVAVTYTLVSEERHYDAERAQHVADLEHNCPAMTT
jgi:hypothetical protein